MRKLIRKYRMVPSKFVTDRLPSYAAARAELPVTIADERGLQQNNWAESLHVPVRRRERKMQRFRSAGSAQRFLSAHASVYNTFNICRHLITSATKRPFRTESSGHRIRALVRNPEKATALKEQGIEVHGGDLEKPWTLGPAFAGADTVWILTPPGLVRQRPLANR
jgi:DDE domain/NAD(P)H-binding